MNRFVLWFTSLDLTKCAIPAQCTCKTSASTNVLHDTHTLPLHAIQHRLQHNYRTHKNAFWTSTSQTREAQSIGIHYSNCYNHIKKTKVTKSSNLIMPTKINTYYGIKIIRIHTANLTHYEIQHHLLIIYNTGHKLDIKHHQCPIVMWTCTQHFESNNDEEDKDTLIFSIINYMILNTDAPNIIPTAHINLLTLHTS